jgi:predicted enzyme related to lactoylglutathione lyase
MMPDWNERKPSIVFHCSDVVAECKRLEALGVRISMPAKQLSWGMFAIFADPDGNEFGMTGQELAPTA